MLNDPATFCSSRGVGLSDFAKEKPWRPQSIILEADPPEHTRTRAVLSQVLSPTAMKQVRDRFAAAAAAKVDELLARRSFDAIADLAEAYPLVDLSRCARPEAGRARASAALCRRGLQRVRTAEPVAPGRDRALGAASGLCRRTVPARESRPRRLRRLHPCPRRCRRHHRGRRRRCWCVRCCRPGSIPPSTASAPPSIAWRAFPINWRGCAAIPRWRAMRSRRRCASKARCRPSSAPRRGRSRSAGIAIGEGEKVLMFLGRRQPRSAPLGRSRQLRHHPPHQRPCRLRLGHPHVRRPACRAPRRRGDDGGDRAQGRQHRDHGTGEAPLQQHAARAGEPSRSPFPPA